MAQKITNINVKKKRTVVVIVVRYNLRAMMRIVGRDGRVTVLNQSYGAAVNDVRAQIQARLQGARARENLVPAAQMRPAQSVRTAQSQVQAPAKAQPAAIAATPAKAAAMGHSVRYVMAQPVARPAQSMAAAPQQIMQPAAQQVAQKDIGRPVAQRAAQIQKNTMVQPARINRVAREKDILPVMSAMPRLAAQPQPIAVRRPRRLDERPVATNTVARSIATNAPARMLKTNPMPVKTPGRVTPPVRMTMRTAPAHNPLDKARPARVVKMNRAMDARRRMLLNLAAQYQRAA